MTEPCRSRRIGPRDPHGWPAPRGERVGRAGAALALAGFLLATACGPRVPDNLADDLGAAYAALAAEAEARTSVTVTGREGWLFFAPELRHLAGGAFPSAGARAAEEPAGFDPFAAIVAFHRELASRGVELLLVPVPPKAIIYADKVGVDDPLVPVPVPRLDPHHQTFYARLRSEGVDILDLTDRFLDDRFHGEGPLYCRQDSHWSGVGCVVAAQEIAAALRMRPWFAAMETRAYRFGWQSTTIEGDLGGEQGAAPPREELRLRAIAAGDGGRPSPVPAAPDSPITLLGDTHALVFHAGQEMHAVGAGLADQLAFELGMPLDVVAFGSPGAALADLRRRAQADPEYWDGKRLVLWCFAARAFTADAAWRGPPSGG